MEIGRNTIDRILTELREKNCLFPQYGFCKENGNLKLLGKGGFAYVYEIYDKSVPDRHYALKVMVVPKHSAGLKNFRESAERQMYLSKLSPYIVKVIEVSDIAVTLDNDERVIDVSRSEDAGDDAVFIQFIVMEKLQGIILHDFGGKVSLTGNRLRKTKEIIQFAIQMSEALHTAHNNKVLHRDVKLENIFWSDEDKVYKLGDFDLSKYSENGNAETVILTYGYAAPEIVNRTAYSYDETADMYSLGITIYLLLNNLNFPGANNFVANKVQYMPDYIFPAPVNSYAELTRVIRKMCSYESADRYNSLSEVVGELVRILDMDEVLSDGSEICPDLVTETYKLTEKTEKEQNVVYEYYEGREERDRRLAKTLSKYYGYECVGYLVIMSVLIAAGLFIVGADTSCAYDWHFWCVIVFVFTAGILQNSFIITELFGRGIYNVIFTAGIIYLIFSSKLTLQYAVIYICIISGIPTLTVSSALGITLWMVLVTSGVMSDVQFLYRYQIVGIIVVIFMFAVKKFCEMNIGLAEHIDDVYNNVTIIGKRAERLYDRLGIIGIVTAIAAVALFVISKKN